MAITVAGSDSLKTKFGKLKTVASGQMLERALVTGALPIMNEAKRQVPKLTGNAARSIHIGGHNELNPGGAGVINTNGLGVPEPEISAFAAAIYVGTDVIYAPMLEYGTSRMGAQPFLRPAFDREYKGAIDEVGRTLSDLIKSVI